MAIWPPPTDDKLEEVQKKFSVLLRKFAEELCDLDDSHVVTDANVNEARKLLMRGDRKKRSLLIAVVRGVLELLGGGFVGAAIPLCLGNPSGDLKVLIVFFLVGGIVMFVVAKILEHLTIL